MILLNASLLFSFILIPALSLAVMVHLYPIRDSAATRSLLFLLVALIIVSLAAIGVYSVQDFQSKVLFSRLRFLGYGGLSPLWLLFISTSFERLRWLRSNFGKIFLFGPFLMVVVFTLVPAWNDLIIKDFAPISVAGFQVLSFKVGSFFRVHLWTSYLQTVLSYYVFASVFWKESAQRKRQIVILFAGAALPLFIDVFGVSTQSPARWLMISTASFSVFCVALAATVFRERLFDVKPIATEKVFNDIPDPILVFDERSRLRSFNKAAHRSFGIPLRAFGRPQHEIFPWLHLDETEISILDSDGRQRFFQLRTERLNLREHEAEGCIALFREITVQKAVEKELNRNLVFKADLLSLVAHDLVGNIHQQALISSLLQKQVGPELKQTAELLTDSTMAAQDLITNVLDWVRLQESQFQPQYRKFEMSVLISECLENLMPNAKIRDVQLEKDLPSSAVIVDGDSMMISSVIRNLIANALRASGPGHKVSVRYRVEDSKLHVSVSDQGPGMTPAQVEALTQGSGRFASFQEGTKERAGYGIGLKIVQRFIDLHAGLFWIESNPGEGTRACFWIPLEIPKS